MAAELHETAKALVADDKGILAADESSGTIEKPFDSISLESTEENRRAYRDMLFTTPDLEQLYRALNEWGGNDTGAGTVTAWVES